MIVSLLRWKAGHEVVRMMALRGGLAGVNLVVNGSRLTGFLFVLSRYLNIMYWHLIEFSVNASIMENQPFNFSRKKLENY